MTFERRTGMFDVKVTSRRIIKVAGVNVPVGRWHTFDMRDGYFRKTFLGRIKECGGSAPWTREDMPGLAALIAKDVEARRVSPG